MADFSNPYAPDARTAPSGAKPTTADPNDEPNPANPGGVSNNELARRQAALARTSGVGGGESVAPTAVAASNAAARQYTPFVKPKVQTLGGALTTLGTAALAPIPAAIGAGTRAVTGSNTAGMLAGAASGGTPVGAAVGAAAGGGMFPTTTPSGGGGAAPKPAAAGAGTGGSGVTPPASVQGDPGAAAAPLVDPNGVTTGNFVKADRTAYDAAAQDLGRARDTFQSELNRLSGVDPFGNQAFLQKATDRAVAQAAGTAAMARGGAAAQAGALRGQQGVQSQLSARGIQEMEQQKVQDANASAGLRLTAAQGMANVAQGAAQNEVSLVNAQLSAAETNLKGYLGGQELGQKERDSLRGLATEMAKVDMSRYQTDVDYRKNVDDNIIAKYTSDNALAGVMAQVAAGENISKGEFIMGLLGAGAGIGQGLVMKSDRRSKYAVRAPKLQELQEYLGASPGSHYRYRQPTAPGQRAGENYGPMAQDLQKTKIGRSVVVTRPDGLYVDTGRLALADHGALAALAQRVERLASRVRGGKKAPTK